LYNCDVYYVLKYGGDCSVVVPWWVVQDRH